MGTLALVECSYEVMKRLSVTRNSTCPLAWHVISSVMSDNKKLHVKVTIAMWFTTIALFGYSIYSLLEDEVNLKGAVFSLIDEPFSYWFGISILFGFSIFILIYTIKLSVELRTFNSDS